MIGQLGMAEMWGGLDTIYRIRMVPRNIPAGELSPIVGNLKVGPTGVLLVTPDTRMAIIASWKFAECQDIVISEDDRTVAFTTGRDDGSEEVMLVGETNHLGWISRIAWKCHTDGVQAGIDLLDQMQLAHHRNRVH